MFVYFKSPLKYSEPISHIKGMVLIKNYHLVIKPIQDDNNTSNPQSTDVDTFEDYVLSIGKEFIIINLS